MTPLKDMLSGENAFYNQPNYAKNYIESLKSKKALPALYSWNTESKVKRYIKLFFSIIIFPIGIYNLLHHIGGKIIFPGCSFLQRRHVNKWRDGFEASKHLPFIQKSSFKNLRFSVEVDGCKIDAEIRGTPETFKKKKWVLFSNGNNGCHEMSEMGRMIRGLDANILMFNYPGFQASEGSLNRKTVAKTYRAMLKLLEDDVNGIGAKQIIGWGLSAGAAVQAEALKNHRLKEGIAYVFVKDRTFCDLSTEASLLVNRICGFLVWILGWNMDTYASSKKLNAPEFILQTADVKKHQWLKNSKKIIGDGIILKDASLAKKVLDNDKNKNQSVLGIMEDHHQQIQHYGFISHAIFCELTLQRLEHFEFEQEIDQEVEKSG